jgi:hypothetical protein
MTLLILWLCGMVALAASITPKWGDYIFNVHVKSHGGERVDVAVPLSLLKTSMKVMPKDIRNICSDLGLTHNMIIGELQSCEGEDIINIKGRDEVRIYVSAEQKLKRGFLRVHVKEKNGPNINIWIPRGLIAFAGNIVSTFGLVDHFVEMPQEIKELHVLKPVSDYK